MVFSAKELEKITQGKWKNLKTDLMFDNFNFSIVHAKKDDFFVTRSHKQFPHLKNPNEDKLSELEEIGVAAIMIRDRKFNTSLPALIVENTKDAFEKIALVARAKTDAKIILVTGSYGKTGFKIRLHQLIEQELKTKIVPNSGNESSGIYKAMSIINKEDEVAIIEVGVSKLEKAISRSKIVQPDICVITSIGHEHIEKHKTLQNTIFNKAAVTQNLPENGIVVIPQDKYYKKLKEAILKHNPHAVIKTFGNDATCDAYVIRKKFVDFGWDIQASIAGKIIEYRIPFIDAHAIEASLSEFLTAHLLGVHLEKIAPRYKTIHNYKSSGKLYKLQYNKKNFHLYDQSRRGGLEGYGSFFRSIKNIIPKENSKKIVITSEFVDIKDGEYEYIDTKEFKNLINEAHIDVLYSVENFTIHDEVVKNSIIWKKHYPNVQDLSDVILDLVEDGDVLCVKAIFESSMKTLVKNILHHATLIENKQETGI